MSTLVQGLIDHYSGDPLLLKAVGNVLTKTGGPSISLIKNRISELAKSYGNDSIWAKIEPSMGGWNQTSLIPKSFKIEVDGAKILY